MSNDRLRLRALSVGYLEYRAAASVRSEFRYGLERLKLTGYGIDWFEQKCWFYSRFFVRGHPTILAAIRRAVDRTWTPQPSNTSVKQAPRGTLLDLLA
jgi:hypothetical protein